jgi:hypothetical protein
VGEGLLPPSPLLLLEPPEDRTELLLLPEGLFGEAGGEGSGLPDGEAEANV